MTLAELLTQQQVERVHEASLEILEDVGMVVRNEEARAMQHVRELLRRNNPAVFSPEVDARIRGEFTGLVAGDAPVWKG